jgi:predicted exporter
MISALSAALIAGFLLWRYRSLLVLLVVAVPLAAGTLAGAAAVALVFGHVHGAAFGFGMTMLGVAADYPILLVSGRRPGEGLPATARRIWPPLRLAAGAAAAGMLAMILSGFPGLAQLGLFAAAGLPAAALVTRFVLPRLMPEAAIETRALPASWMRALLALPAHRGAAVATLGVAALFLAAIGGPAWERNLAALSPVPRAQRDLDAELRRQIGAPDVGVLIVLRGAGEEQVLQASERVAAALAPLVASGAITGFDAPSRWLPSAATQRARQAALPDAETLRARLDEARGGLPFRPTAFDRFVGDVEASRRLAPLTRRDLAASPLLAARLDPLLRPPGGPGEPWQAVIAPTGLRDPAALRAALADPALGQPLVIEVKAETEALVAAATRRALLWTAAGGLLVLGLLALGLGGPGAALRTAAPLAGALLVTVAVLSAAGERLSLFHLVSLLLLAGVGMDYALFLARSGGEAERARALGSVLNCTLTTLLTFGLLALCSTPVLRGIGLTVAIGVAAAFLLAATLAPRAEARR